MASKKLPKMQDPDLASDDDEEDDDKEDASKKVPDALKKWAAKTAKK